MTAHAATSPRHGGATARPAARLRGREVVVGALAYGAGLAAVGGGLGLAGSHLVKVGLVPLAAAGLLAVAVGIGLVVVGGRRVWRGTPGWWRLLALPALLLAAPAVVAPLAQAVAVTVVPPIPLGSLLPADRGLVAESVTFVADDGVRLSGWYVPSRGGAAVALLHGAGSTRTAVLDHAAVLARNGYGVLLYDARGHGRSQGRAMELGWHGDADAAGAVTYLRSRPEVDPRRIALLGLSMGGEQAIGAAAGDGRVRAVVAEGATGRVAADEGWLADVHGLRGRLTMPVEHLATAVTDLLTDAEPPLPLRTAAAAMAPRPLLLIAAGEVSAEQHAAAWIRAGSPRSVQVWTVSGAGHTAALRVAPDAWERRVIGFLDTALGQSGRDPHEHGYAVRSP